jgi:hypothetical protein
VAVVTKQAGRLNAAIAVGAVIAIFFALRAVVNVDDPGKTVRWEVQSTNVMQVLVTRVSGGTGDTEYLAGSSKGPTIVGNKGGERGRLGFTRRKGATVVRPGEVATVVIIARVDDPLADTSRSQVMCRVEADGQSPVEHYAAKRVECALTISAA